MKEKEHFVFAPPSSKKASIVINPVPPIFEDPEHTPAQRFWWKHHSCCSTPSDLKSLEDLPLAAFDKKKEARDNVVLPRRPRTRLIE